MPGNSYVRSYSFNQPGAILIEYLSICPLPLVGKSLLSIKIQQFPKILNIRRQLNWSMLVEEKHALQNITLDCSCNLISPQPQICLSF